MYGTALPTRILNNGDEDRFSAPARTSTDNDVRESKGGRAPEDTMTITSATRREHTEGQVAKGLETMAPDTSTPAAGSHSPLAGSPDGTETAHTAILDIATKAKNKAQAVAQAASASVDQHRGSAARVLANAASTIHDGATRLPGGEGVTRLAEAAADRIDATAQYVRAHNTQQMMVDLKQFVRRHPGVSVVGAAVVGLFVGRGFRKH